MGVFLLVVLLAGGGIGLLYWMGRAQRRGIDGAMGDAIRQFGLKPADPVHIEDFDDIWHSLSGTIREVPVAVVAGHTFAGQAPGLGGGGKLTAMAAPPAMVRVSATYPKPLAHQFRIARRDARAGATVALGDGNFDKTCALVSPAAEELKTFLSPAPIRNAVRQLVGHTGFVVNIGQHEIRAKVFDHKQAIAAVRECASLALRLHTRAAELGWPPGPPPPAKAPPQPAIKPKPAPAAGGTPSAKPGPTGQAQAKPGPAPAQSQPAQGAGNASRGNPTAPSASPEEPEE